MYIAEISALSAALCWSFNGIVSTHPARELGAIAFNRTRLTTVFILLGTWCVYFDSWGTLRSTDLLYLSISAVLGIVIGDTLMQFALIVLGPRRAGVLFSANAPIMASLAYLYLGERMSLFCIIGSASILAGIILAILSGNTHSDVHHYERVLGRLALGTVLGLIGAFAQAISMIILRPILSSGVDPFAVGTLRIGVAAILLNIHMIFSSRSQSVYKPMNLYLCYRSAASGVLGMAVGMTLYLIALSYGPAGTVATLGATGPILVLPQLWIFTGQAPCRGAWLGGTLAFAGAAMVFWK